MDKDNSSFSALMTVIATQALALIGSIYYLFNGFWQFHRWLWHLPPT